jgi:putative oxidoreductase
MSLATNIANLYRPAVWLDEQVVAPAVNLALRAWVGWIFFKSGLTKIQSMDTTIMLFEYEYEVPLFSPAVAAYMGTAAELILPVLLVLGIGGRFAAIALFVFNIVAVVSYPSLNEIGKVWHYAWGIALLPAMLYGPGTLSIDNFIRRKFMPDS